MTLKRQRILKKIRDRKSGQAMAGPPTMPLYFQIFQRSGHPELKQMTVKSHNMYRIHYFQAAFIITSDCSVIQLASVLTLALYKSLTPLATYLILIITRYTLNKIKRQTTAYGQIR